MGIERHKSIKENSFDTNSQWLKYFGPSLRKQDYNITHLKNLKIWKMKVQQSKGETTMIIIYQWLALLTIKLICLHTY